MSYLQLVSRLRSIQNYGGPIDNLLYPIIYGFSVEDVSDVRVYFKSTEPISATNVNITSFKVSYRTITSVTINGDALTGHYFTVSVAITFWHIMTLEYTGVANSLESTLQDGNGNGLHDFTYEYIANNSIQPSTSATKWANADGGGLHDGSNDINAWSYAEMASSPVAGDLVNVKVGSKVGTLFFNKSGTISSPIVYQGYKVTPGDITTNYLNGEPESTWDDTEMPTVIGTSRLVDTGWQSQGLDYVIFKNIQVRECRWAIQNRISPTNNVIYENINAKDLGNSSAQADLAGYFFDGYSDDVVGNKIQFKNCISYNASQTHILTVGNNWLIKDCEMYCTQAGNHSGVDYGIALQGDRNVVKDCIIEWTSGLQGDGGGFGVSVKARHPFSLPTARYNLIDGVKTSGFAEGINFRWRNAEYNVAKNCVLDGGNQPSSGGLAFRDGASFNIFENSIISNPNQDWYCPIMYFDSSGEDGTGQTLEGNIVRNTIIKGGSIYEEATVAALNFGLSRNGTSIAFDILDCEIINCTFYNLPEMYNLNTGVTLTNFKLTNCIVDNIPIRYNGNNPSITETYCNHYTFWGTNGVPESGTGNISVDPQFVDTVDLVPQNALLKVGTPIVGVEYDISDIERDQIDPTIGANEI